LPRLYFAYDALYFRHYLLLMLITLLPFSFSFISPLFIFAAIDIFFRCR